MAKPPGVSSLTRDSIPEAPEWLDKVLLPLNSALGPTRAALAKGLTHHDNFRCTVREGVSVVAADALSVFIGQDFVGPVYRVEVTATEDAGPGAGALLNIHPVPTWTAATQDGKQGVSIRALSGLTNGTKYLLDVTLLAK